MYNGDNEWACGFNDDYDEDADMEHRLYLNSDNKITVIALFSYEENEYDITKFYRDLTGGIPSFAEEDDAIEYLNKYVRRECIDPKYLSVDNMTNFFDSYRVNGDLNSYPVNFKQY